MKNPMHTSILLSLAGRTPQRFDVAGVDPVTGFRVEPRDPWTCFVENEVDGSETDDPADDAGDESENEADEKRYSKTDMEKAVKYRLSKARRQLSADKRADEKRIAEMEAQIAELSEQLEGKGDEDQAVDKKIERELAKALQSNKALEETVAALTGERDGSKTALKSYIVRDKLRNALSSAKALPKGLDHAVRLMADEMKADLVEEDGEQVVVVTFDGNETDDISGAAQGWLKSNSHFAAHPGGGGGEVKSRKGPAGFTNGLTPEAVAAADPAALIQSGMESALRGK